MADTPKNRTGASSNSAFTHTMFNHVYNPASNQWEPMTAGSGGTGGGTVTTTPAVVKSAGSKTLTDTAEQVALGLPAEATHARVEVTSGAVAWAFGAAGPSTGQLGTGDALTLSGAELAAVRLTRSGTADAQVFVSWQVVG